MSRALGVDLGSRRIGVALSDESGTAASPLTVVERVTDRASDHETILGLALEHNAATIVVGLPLRMDGGVGPAARRVLSEVDELRRWVGDRVRVEVHDERLSTVTAERALAAGGVRRHRRRQKIDKVAAAVILQAWLDAQGSR